MPVSPPVPTRLNKAGCLTVVSPSRLSKALFKATNDRIRKGWLQEKWYKNSQTTTKLPQKVLMWPLFSFFFLPPSKLLVGLNTTKPESETSWASDDGDIPISQRRIGILKARNLRVPFDILWSMDIHQLFCVFLWVFSIPRRWQKVVQNGATFWSTCTAANFPSSMELGQGGKKLKHVSPLHGQAA